MARAYASTILKAPVQTVWSLIRDFNGLPSWAPDVATSKIENELDADVVGCVRSFYNKAGDHIRERLLAMDDARYTFTYNFEKPAFPVKHYIAAVRLYPVTATNETFAEWTATFDEAPGDEGKYVKIVSNDVFGANWASLAKIIKARKLQTLPERPLWKGGQPNKVWTSRAINAPVQDVWKIMRDFAGMGAWHGDITKMKMLRRARPDKVSGIRDFYFGEGHIDEELLHLDDLERSFSYRITKSEIAWINYVSGPRLWPVTSSNSTFGVWTGDWQASAHDDLSLMPNTEQNVYQRAFAELEKNFFKNGKLKS